MCFLRLVCVVCISGLAAMASQAGTSDLGQPSATGPMPIVLGDGPFAGVTRKNGASFRIIDNVSIHVVSASRISNDRIAVYLGSREEIAESISLGFTHGDSFLELSPLVQPTTRLTLSNVYPEIPNSVLLHNISSFCKVVSPIRPIPLGFKNKQLSHIMLFRHHVQVLVKPNVTLPGHINFYFSGVNYRVFLSTESVRCFNCGEFGHISRSCKKPRPPPDDDDDGDNDDELQEPTNPLNPTNLRSW